MVLQWLRSLVFNAQMYLAMLIYALVYIGPSVVSRDWAFHGVHAYCRWVRWTASWMVGLRSEVRGTPPSDEVLIASKHQSFFDIIILVSVLPRPKFIMKKELKYAPILGWFALRIGCVPVDRGKRGKAVADMVKAVSEGRAQPGQLVIYPQGTRVAPGAHQPYKVGAAVLYEQLGQDCVPVATNVGLFWPRSAVMRRPGLAVVEFLPRIPAGQTRDKVLPQLETAIETASDALMAEAGYRPDPKALT